jgi:hypothetical protein
MFGNNQENLPDLEHLIELVDVADEAFGSR